tara:strand:+ start:932 stop:1117 length:186 start_codon:yes stop_codon:yes gene_type:complete
MHDTDLEKNLIKIVEKCIIAIMDNKDRNFQFKEDGTKLTLADIKSHKIIKKSLLTLYPEVP